MRLALGCLLLASACAAPAPPGGAVTVADQDWIGTIFCEPIPDFARLPLRQPLQVHVRGGVARYERNVRIADTVFDSGFKEAGEGAVGPGGRVELNGSGSQRNASYQARYTGVLDGAHTRLDGVQHWQFDRHTPFDRPCHIDLTHQL